MLNPFKQLAIILVTFFCLTIIIVPILSILAPIHYMGDLFNNTFGNMSEDFGNAYTGAFSIDLDKYQASNKVSVNYNQVLACAFADWEGDPSECLKMIDSSTGMLNTDVDKNEYFEIDWNEYHGTYSSSYFSKIHVLGKYTEELYEKVGEHLELVDEEDEYGTIKQVEKVVDDYEWVYYEEMKRGKCENTESRRCHITLDDRYVYPYQYVSAGIKERYGLKVDEDTYELSIDPKQIWRGSSLIAFSKGEVISTGNKLSIRILANDIDLIATYEGSVSSLFEVGEIVEATELIGYADGQFKFYVQNSSGEYINPSLFLQSATHHNGSGVFSISGIANYSVIANSPLGYTPDFDNAAAWRNAGDGGTNPYAYGQCTWFAYGVYYELYGHAPNVSGNGTSFASTLNEDGWTLNETLTPGSMVSATWLPDHPYGTVAIVGEIVDDDHMYIFHGNSNANLSADSWDTAIYDWSYQLVSTKGYTYANGSFAAWDVASPPSDND